MQFFSGGPHDVHPGPEKRGPDAVRGKRRESDSYSKRFGRVSVSKWRDITAECDVSDSGAIQHEGKDIYWDVRYRMVKISGPLQPHVAFIVEKQA